MPLTLGVSRYNYQIDINLYIVISGREWLMVNNLWSKNCPQKFWQLTPDPGGTIWNKAIQDAIPLLGLDLAPGFDIDNILALTLGEERFGPEHWTLSVPKKVYYRLKPLIPKMVGRKLRQVYRHVQETESEFYWPIDNRYVDFLWEVLAWVLKNNPNQEYFIKPLWPDNQRFGFVLTHDVETEKGLKYVRKLADIEEGLGFRSSFNFVLEDYTTDPQLIMELRQRGFEVGVHGLKHDGCLFNAKESFDRDASCINDYLLSLEACGFRSPLTHRNPEWMQSLFIEYDLSFFDTDPFEPIPGGTMSIWPFFIGHFVELPYTLAQDCTLINVLGHTSPRLWLEKISFIKENYGLALVNTHPDYLLNPDNLRIYVDFLEEMINKSGYWHALPRDVARWWQERASGQPVYFQDADKVVRVVVDGDRVRLLDYGVKNLVYPELGLVDQ